MTRTDPAKTLTGNFDAHPAFKAHYLRWAAGREYGDGRDDIMEKATRWPLTDRQVAWVLRDEPTRAEADAARAAASPSDYVGDIGQRLTIPVTVTEARPYYERQIVTCEDADANVIVVWVDADRAGFEPGARFTLTATVRKHAPFRGVKQTTMNRPKWAAPAVTAPIAVPHDDGTAAAATARALLGLPAAQPADGDVDDLRRRLHRAASHDRMWADVMNYHPDVIDRMSAAACRHALEQFFDSHVDGPR